MSTTTPQIEASPDAAIVWQGRRLYLLDQRRLPHREEYLQLVDAGAVAAAIRDMVVRGAPAIGITAAYGVVLGARARYGESPADWRMLIESDLARLADSRPTAANLVWALDRMRALFGECGGEDPEQRLLDEARAIHREDIEANRRMGELGADLIDSSAAVITHCNAGALATGGYGTALGVIRTAFAAGKIEQVYADETRPWLQGSRLTAWELLRSGIPVTLLADGAAASLMAKGGIDWVIVGSDRIAANGDVANKIGTYGLATAARHHGVKVMVVAPASTVDMSLDSGAGIPIEIRGDSELLSCGGVPVGAPGAAVWNPVFDVTPASMVDVIITERGVVQAPDAARMAVMMGG